MIDRLLQKHLDPLVRDHLRWTVCRRLAVCWAAAAVAGLAFILIRLLTGWSSPWVFPLLVAAAGLAALGVWKRARADRPDYSRIARKIETEDPSLHALLVTAVEQEPDPATGQLNFFQQRVIDQAVAWKKRHLWSQHSATHTFLAECAHAAALVLFAGVLVFLYPGSTAARRAALTSPDGVTVTPGDVELERGSSLVVLARFDGRIPPEATLVVEPVNREARRIPLVRSLEDPVFGGSVPDVRDALTYRVEYDGRQTREFKIGVFDHPALTRADARVTYPDYTALSEKLIPDTRRISAVEGSTVQLKLELNKAVAEAGLIGNEERPWTLVPDPAGSNVYHASLRLSQSGRYHLHLVDHDGRTNKTMTQFVIEVLSNRPPELKIAFPRGDQRVSAIEEIAFQAEASDDFGLKAYGFAYGVAGQPEHLIELGGASGPNEKKQFTHLLSVEDLDVSADQLVSYYLWADDIGPDGAIRRTESDMFFAEIRPFEEIFREGQQGGGGGSGEQQQGESEKLAELQKDIINATWKLRRRETGPSPSPAYAKDAGVVLEAQQQALELAGELKGRVDDPRMKSLVELAEKEMTAAARELAGASGENSLKFLPPALAAEQSAYQALLKLQAREIQVSRGGGGGRGGGRSQRQLDQLDLQASENRYETQSQAEPSAPGEQREQLQVLSRLKELAQRQQDINEQLKEMQTALQEAKSEEEREQIRRQLQRLREEQQDLLADVDELSQRMGSSENQSRMADSRQELEQTRADVQRAAEALEQQAVSQALASGTRAERNLDKISDEFRQRTSSQFAEEMRQMRQDARELANRQEEIGGQLDALGSGQRKTLSDSEERDGIASALSEQKQKIEEILSRAEEITTKAETAEPALSRQLYDTLRKASQDDVRNVRETTEELVRQGRLLRPVYERLESAKSEGRRSVEVAADLLRDGFASEAGDLERRARQSVNDLKRGIERAAESVIGDDTEALRLARREIEELSRQLDREIANASGNSSEQPGGTASGESPDPAQRGQDPARAEGQEPGAQARSGDRQASTSAPGRRGETSEGSTESANAGEEAGREGGTGALAQAGTQPGGSDGRGEGPEGEPGSARQGSAQGRDQAGNPARSGSAGSGGPAGGGRAGGRNGSANFFDQSGGSVDGGGISGPITGADFVEWSDRLRNVEEMLDLPDLRTEVARVRDRARAMRQEFKRHSKEPQWDLVRLELSGPLVEISTRISEELARRQSKEAVVPVDRDPVPARYSELVRRYYEELGKSE